MCQISQFIFDHVDLKIVREPQTIITSPPGAKGEETRMRGKWPHHCLVSALGPRRWLHYQISGNMEEYMVSL